VGLTPARGLREEAAFAATIEIAKSRGARVSYKATPAGPVPYELNCSYLSVCAPASLGGADIRARAFLAAQGVLLSLSGLPAVYFHSWVGSEAWEEGPALLGAFRAINREKPPIDRVEQALGDPASLGGRIYRGMSRFLEFRRAEEAFDPGIAQRVLTAGGSVFALLRGPDSRGRYVLCAENLGPGVCSLTLPAEGSGEPCAITLEPWESRWIGWGAGGRRELSTMNGEGR
jgi:sucrose phosphorylase